MHWYVRVAASLREKKVSNAEVGRELGISGQAITLKLQGKRPVTVEEAPTIALLIDQGLDMRVLLAVLLALACLGVPGESYGHSGGTDSSGCHTNRKTGDYHCHGGGRAAAPAYQPQSLAPALSSAASSGSRPFANCAEARAANAAPVYAGTPGYGRHLDRDGDGVGCEPYNGR